MNRQVLSMLGLASFVLAGCAGPVEEAEVTAALAPMVQPDRAVGYTWTGLRNGEPFSMKIVSDNGDAWDWETSDGCKFTSSKLGFAPGKKWSNCGNLTDGQQTSVRTGDVWPLEVGKRWSYALSGSNAKGNSWESTRNCEVVSTTNIKTALGPTDAYKVMCRDKWNVRTFYFSPEMGELVFWEWHRKNQNQRIRHEITEGS